MTVGGLTGFGFASMSMGINGLLERESLKLWLINAGYQTLLYMVMGGIINWWK